MKNYQLQKSCEIEQYPYIVYSVSYISPIEELPDIAEELKNHFQGKVLFDLLLSNGISSNRFLEAEFDGVTFNYSSFKSLSNVNELIKKGSSMFYQSNIEFLENSVLPNAHQFLVKKGKLI
ncbi:type II toxin-antitoxin system RnlB family antitoxin [Bacillus cereus]|uniref:type II toxin-antitoxin system RnlB family antitoxin n=1 Tax=Bacillus cereus TaxID=1396 RepID=UPI00235E7DE6|nr:type II toxin-antitoxin system RnlB family antitoxin [Bacillus cereus]MDD0822344.1 type II toxin-antitoxin system RnlB family antitoxin [Bacillus cereus]